MFVNGTMRRYFLPLSVLTLAVSAVSAAGAAGMRRPHARIAASNAAKASAETPAGATAAKFTDEEPTPPVPITNPKEPTPDAYLIYIKAIEAVKDVRYENEDLVLTDSDKQAIVTSNAEAFKLVREAEKYPFQAIPIRTFNIDFDSFTWIRSLSRLLRFRSEYEASQGNWPEAAEWALDGIQMGVKMQQGGPLIQALVGMAVESIARKPLADAIPHLNAHTAAEVAGKLAAIENGRTSYSAILREEEIASEASVLEIMHDPKQWTAFIKDAAYDGKPLSRQKALDLYVKYMDHAIASAEKPYNGDAKWPAYDKGLEDMEKAGDPIYRVRFDADRTDNALMVAQLGLQAFRQQYAEYPEKLSAVSPTFLPTLPSDPFSPNNPIRYIKTGRSYILYSVGPDGKDDNGAPIDDPRLDSHDTTGRLRHIVTAGSKGDIVAGVNTF